MAGVNKVILVGRLGADPEMKYTNSGTGVCRFNLATSENWTGKDGQKQERTEWHRVVAWAKLGELCNEYLKKGRQAYVEGRLQTRSWNDKEGNKKYSTEIVATTVQFLGSADRQGTKSTTEEASPSEDASFLEEPAEIKDEDIPF